MTRRMVRALRARAALAQGHQGVAGAEVLVAFHPGADLAAPVPAEVVKLRIADTPMANGVPGWKHWEKHGVGPGRRAGAGEILAAPAQFLTRAGGQRSPVPTDDVCQEAGRSC